MERGEIKYVTLRLQPFRLITSNFINKDDPVFTDEEQKYGEKNNEEPDESITAPEFELQTEGYI